MKKNILILFILLLFPGNINAEDDCNNKYIKDSYKEYKWYNLKEESSYFNLGNNSEEYNKLDKEDYILTEYSDWDSKKPDNIEGRTIKTKKEYFYKEYFPIKYIFINSIKSKLKILNEEDIYIENGIDIKCVNCKYEKGSYLLNEGSYLKIKLDENFDIKKINYLFKNIEYLEIYFSVDDNLEDISYKGEYINDNLKINKVKEYYKEKIYDKKIEQKNLELISEKTMYQYQDYLYRYFKIVKDYSEKYSRFKIEGYNYKDEENYIIKKDCEPINMNLGLFKLSNISSSNNQKNSSSDIKTNKDYNTYYIFTLLIIIILIIITMYRKYKKNKLVIITN